MKRTNATYSKSQCLGTMALIIALSSISSSYGFHLSRREVVRNMASIFGGGLIMFDQINVAEAACLAGDLSKECIGVYKVPVDDELLPYVATPEALEKYAPDLNYVPPTKPPASFSQAIDVLTAQRKAAEDIQQVIAEGKLEEGGIKVLNLLPKVTNAGRLVVKTLEEELGASSSSSSNENGISEGIAQLRLMKLEEQLEMVLALWGECDVTIGQGLRGELGVTAVAQLHILSSLRDATTALDDLLTVASLNR